MIVRYLISIECDNEEQAEEVIGEMDDTYGTTLDFDYSLIIEFHSKTEATNG